MLRRSGDKENAKAIFRVEILEYSADKSRAVRIHVMDNGRLITSIDYNFDELDLLIAGLEQARDMISIRPDRQ